jgi:hypothetical protein
MNGIYGMGRIYLIHPKHLINPGSGFKQIMMQLSEGGEGFGIRYEGNNASPTGQNRMNCKRTEAAGYCAEERGIVFSILAHNQRDGSEGFAFGEIASSQFAEDGAAVAFADERGDLLRRGPEQRRLPECLLYALLSATGKLGHFAAIDGGKSAAGHGEEQQMLLERDRKGFLRPAGTRRVTFEDRMPRGMREWRSDAQDGITG